jgi:predicted alpha/beta superfamily hydrolase
MVPTLYGHSYGGLFVTHTLLAEPQLFQTYGNRSVDAVE